MANEENLNPIKKGDLTKEEAKRRGSNGGKKSGESRRIKKTFRELFEGLLSEKCCDSEIKSKMEELFPDLDSDSITNKLCIFTGLFYKAARGDVAAFKELRDTIGEKPVDESKVDIKGSVQLHFDKEDEDV
jgi:hypothetical protein